MRHATLNLARTLLLLTLAPSLGCSALGLAKPEYCEDQGASSLQPWVDSTWAPYCDEFNTRLTEPQNYELVELTEFLSAHPERTAELKTKLTRYKDPKRCFETNAEQLQYRKLSACLEDGPSQDARVTLTWDVRADPWLKEYDFRAKKLRRDLTDMNAAAENIERKIQEKFQANEIMDQPELFVAFDETMSRLEKDMAAVDNANSSYNRILATASSYPALAHMITQKYRPVLDTIMQDHKKNRELFNQLQDQRRFLRFAVYSVGRTCPTGVRANNELKAARTVLKEKIAELGASTPRITETVQESKSEDEFTVLQTFRGVICATRNTGNQVVGKPEMCAKHLFTIQRSRGVDDKRWDDWTLQSLEEGGPKEGVDCTKF